MTYVVKNEEEINKIALGILSGTCFGSWSEEVMRHSFLIIGLCLTKDLLDTWKAMNVVHIYEFIEKAGPMSVNGYPSFMSFSVIDAGDWGRVISKVEALEGAMKPATGAVS